MKKKTGFLELNILRVFAVESPLNKIVHHWTTFIQTFSPYHIPAVNSLQKKLGTNAISKSNTCYFFPHVLVVVSLGLCDKHILNKSLRIFLSLPEQWKTLKFFFKLHVQSPSRQILRCLRLPFHHRKTILGHRRCSPARGNNSLTQW